jgi:hypothetical protein
MIKLDGFDEAIIGPAMVWNGGSMDARLVYDAEKIREVLMERDGMSHEDAREFIEFNIEGAYVGPQTPVLVWKDDVWDMGDEEDESWNE